ncbi:MAG: cation transporting ATPase C-terminal domain-containing protein [Gordonia amarae]
MGCAAGFPARRRQCYSLVACSGYIIQRRSIHGFFTRFQFRNAQLWWAMAAGIAITLVYVPAVADFFQCGPLDAVDWLLVHGGAVIFLAVGEASGLFSPPSGNRLWTAGLTPA